MFRLQASAYQEPSRLREADPVTLRVSAEDALLLDVAGGARGAALAVASGPPKWDRVLEAARWHRLGQLLWEHQQRPGAVQAPADVEHQSRGTSWAPPPGASTSSSSSTALLRLPRRRPASR